MKYLILTVLSLNFCSVASIADHSWDNYHWARSTSSFDLVIINSTTEEWDGYVEQSVADWSVSSAATSRGRSILRAGTNQLLGGGGAQCD